MKKTPVTESASGAPATNRHNNIALLILLLLAMVIRGGVLFAPGASQSSFRTDPDGYARLAVNLRDHNLFGDNGLPTAHRPPLYPIILSGLSSVRAVSLFHWGLGIAAAFFVFQTAITLNRSPAPALIAGLLLVVDPTALVQSRLIMTETLALFFSSLLFYLLIRFSVVTNRSSSPTITFFTALFLGIICGLATLTRPAFLVLTLLVILTLLLMKKPIYFRFICGIAVLSGTSGILLPWVIRNHRQMGSPVITTTHDGYTMLLANNRFLFDCYRHHSPWEKAWDAGDFHLWWNEKVKEETDSSDLTASSELTINRSAKKEAISAIKNDPGMFAQTTMIRIGNLWQMLPYRIDDRESTTKTAARVAVGLFYFAELLMGGAGALILIIRRKSLSVENRSLLLWGLILIASVQLPHLLFWTNMRMRVVLLPAIICFAGSLFLKIGKKS